MNEWFKGFLELLAAFGTLLAALSARKSAKISNIQLNNQIEEKRRIDRPRLVPLNHVISTEISSFFTDWQTNEDREIRKFEEDNKMSRFYVPLINTGNTHAFDVRCSFKLQRGIYAFQENYESERVKLERPDGSSTQDEDYFEFNVTTIFPGYNQRNETQNVKVESCTQFFPLIQNDKSSKIYMPKFFIILNNIYLKEYLNPPVTFHKYKVILTIHYKDQIETEHTDRYLMVLSNKQISYNESIFNTWIDFKYMD